MFHEPEAWMWNAEFWSENSPVDHFATPSTLCGSLLAKTASGWVHKESLAGILEIGCDTGKFLGLIDAVVPGIPLAGVDVRPAALPVEGTFLCSRWDTVTEQWQSQSDSENVPIFLKSLPGPILLVAIEWLDDLPAHVDCRKTGHGTAMTTGAGSPGPLPEAERRWLERWWPQPGRVVAGLSRDRAWAWLARHLPRGSVLATLDYGHTRDSRPADGGLAAYRHGRRVRPGPGSNTTAEVAVDSLAATVEALGAQRIVLSRLRDLPPGFWPTQDPHPLRHAALRSQEQLLRDPHRFGDFWLVAHRIGGAERRAAGAERRAGGAERP